MKKRIMIIFVLLLITGVVFAEANPWFVFYTVKDWFAVQSANEVSIPDGLTEREAEIYRAGYANGHYEALHPEYIQGLYVINKKTKKFHLTNCMNTLQIATENREHSTLPASVLMEKYQPCGQCHPEREKP